MGPQVAGDASGSAGRDRAVPSRFPHRQLHGGGRGLTGILDWEFAGWADPMEDVAWFCAKCWRFGANRLEAGGIADRAPFYAGYEAESGRRIDPAEDPFLRGHGPRPLGGDRAPSMRTPFVGRRAGPGARADRPPPSRTRARNPFPDRAGGTMRDKPDIRDLLETARGTLMETLLPNCRWSTATAPIWWGPRWRPRRGSSPPGRAGRSGTGGARAAARRGR